MKGLIISSGEIKNYELLKQLVEEDYYIVCADGGITHLLKIGRFPNIVLGDLDSIREEELNIIIQNKIEIQKFPKTKDETDTELCVDYLLKNGFHNITLMGVIGSRFDHTLANIYLLKKIYNSGATACIIDQNNKIYYVKDEIVLNRKEDSFVSIIPISEAGIIISLNGFLYSLEKEQLKFSSTRGLSNKIVEEYGRIRIHKGDAIVIESKD